MDFEKPSFHFRIHSYHVVLAQLILPDNSPNNVYDAVNSLCLNSRYKCSFVREAANRCIFVHTEYGEEQFEVQIKNNKKLWERFKFDL
jgi:hypothetical protein